MSLHPQVESHREDLANNIKESIASWDEDTGHDVLTALLREAFSANNTYDGSHFEHGDFEDEVLEKFKTLIETIQDQKIEYKATLKARAFMDNMFGGTINDPTWEKIMGQHVNKEV